MKKTWIIAALAAFLPNMVLAVDEGLYEPAPPANSAFVRVIDADSSTPKTNAVLATANYGALNYPSISAYRVVAAGTHPFVAGKIKADITVDAGKYYTVALTSGKATLLDDALMGNPAKARVYFYNLSDAANATLFAPKQKAAILSKQAAGTSTSREVNALTLPLQVLADDKSVKILPDVALKRRVGTSLALVGKKGAYKALMVENSVAR